MKVEKIVCDRCKNEIEEPIPIFGKDFCSLCSYHIDEILTLFKIPTSPEEMTFIKKEEKKDG